MRKPMVLAAMAMLSLVVSCCGVLAGESPSQAARQKKLNVLFIGNSFTACHDLAQVVKAMAEAGNPDLSFDVTTVLYGGRRLVDHWRLGTPNFVKIATLTAEEEQATVKSLEEAIAKDPNDKYSAVRAGPPPATEQESWMTSGRSGTWSCSSRTATIWRETSRCTSSTRRSMPS